jgi:hypothetical protein
MPEGGPRAHTEAVVGAWLDALERRHLASLRFSEVSRALRALSATYVERRDRLARGAALAGGGKRAAFALMYGPLHFLTVRAIVRALPGAAGPLDTIVDLGCGTGASGAAWSLALGGRPRLLGLDRHQWAVTEAAWTYAQLGLRGRTRQEDVTRAAWPTRRSALLAGWIVNELPETARPVFLHRLLTSRRRGATVLIVEPIARGVTPWWEPWADLFVAEGGRADQWRFDAAPLPDISRRLGRAAGLSHDQLTARSLWLPGAGPR